MRTFADIRTRKINHPIMQDAFQVVILLKQRRWRCTNELCRREENETFNFIGKRRRNTNASDFLIVNAFRDLTRSAADIARAFHTSDSHVLDVFDRFVDMKRLPLSDVISIDEVYLNMDQDCRYVLVIQDFLTGDPIDLLKSRRQNVTEPYFAAIPKEERFAVKYLISDMNNEYLRYDNPDGLYNEAGLTCDFIAASRILDEAIDEIDRMGCDPE